MPKICFKNLMVLAAALILLLPAFFYFAARSSKKITRQTADILIINAQILTMDPGMDIYKPGWLAIGADKIIGLGQGKPPAQYIGRKVIDAAGKVVMPGFINTHSHAAMVLLDGLGQNQPLQTWLKTMAAYEQHMSPDDIYWGTALAESKMLESGTTAFNDMYLFEQNTAEAVKLAGMRAVLRVPIQMDKGQASFDENFIAENKNNPLISFSLAPNPLLDYTPAQLKQISDYALAKNYIVHIHFEEDAQARSDAIAKFGLSPLQLINQSGLVRNKIVLAHAVDLTGDETALLSKDPGAGVSFNPISEASLGTPLTPAAQMLAQNIPVALGTDGEPSSNLDMFAQMRAAAASPGLVPQEIVQMAITKGAKVLGLDNQIGSLETGKQADIIIVNIQPAGDVYSALVYNTNGGDVNDSIIAGKIVMENRKLRTLDEKNIIQTAQSISSGLKDLELTK